MRPSTLPRLLDALIISTLLAGCVVTATQHIPLREWIFFGARLLPYVALAGLLCVRWHMSIADRVVVLVASGLSLTVTAWPSTDPFRYLDFLVNGIFVVGVVVVTDLIAIRADGAE